MNTSPNISGLRVGNAIIKRPNLLVFEAEHEGRECLLVMAPIKTHSFLPRCRALMLARHPSVPSVLELGTAEGVDFVVLSAPVGKMLDSGVRLQEPLFTRVAVELAGALSELHGIGLTHGYICAANVVMRDDGGVQLLCSDLLAVTKANREGLSPALMDVFALRDLLHLIAPEGALPETIRHLFAGKIAAAPALFEGLTGSAYTGRRQGRVSPSVDIGRSVELAHIKAVWEKLPLKGGELLWLQGEVGSGKSHLLAHMVEWADTQGATIFAVSGRSADQRPLAGLRRLFEGFAERFTKQPESHQKRLRLRLKKILAGLPAETLVGVAPDLADFIGPVRLVDKRQQSGAPLVEIASEFVVRLASADRPILVAIDDIDALDSQSLDVLQRVAEQTCRRSILFIFTCGTRSDSRAIWKKFLKLAAQDDVQHLTLRALDDSSIMELIRSYLRVETLPEEIGTHLARLSDRTPMSILEILRLIIDQGLLVPYWGRWHLDEGALRQANLPSHTRELVGRRHEALSSNTTGVIRLAAIIGLEFSRSLLLKVNADWDVDAALEEALNAELIEECGVGRFAFVHDSTRDGFSNACSVAERQRLHQRIAVALDDLNVDADSERLQRVAAHYAHGVHSETVERRVATCETAAIAAYHALDDCRARVLFDAADAACVRLGRPLGIDSTMALGEVCLRLGDFKRANEIFLDAHAAASSSRLRAHLLSRIGWLKLATNNLEESYVAHEKALVELGVRPPRNTVPGLLGVLLRMSLSPKRSPEDLELLCTICYQMMRAAVEGQQPLVMLQAALIGYPAARQIGPSGTLARFTAAIGFMQLLLGRRNAGMRKLQSAHDMAETLGDISATTYCLQVEGVLASWCGEIDRAVDIFRRCHAEYGQWQDISEYALVASSESLLHSIRGHFQDAWSPLQRALQRAKHQNSSRAAAHMVFRLARSLLTALGRRQTAELMQEWQPKVDETVFHRGGLLRLVSWTCAARDAVSTGELGDSFERLCDEFDAEAYNPKTVHIIVVEYYVVVAYARVHQLLCCDAGEKRRYYIQKLAEAHKALKLASRIDVIKAHALAVRGCLRWAEGKSPEADFYAALRLAEEENVPWVIYEVARVRAHILRDKGKHGAACDQAIIAATIADRHGTLAQQHWIESEFHLQVQSSVLPPRLQLSNDSQERIRRHLRALVQISQAVVDPTLRADVVLDELIGASHAERGLLLTYERNHPIVAAARTDNQETFAPAGGVLELLMERVKTNTRADRGTEDSVAVGNRHYQYTMTVPLLLGDSFLGTLHLERRVDTGPFEGDDLETVKAIAHQLPVALELARVSKEREGLESHIQQANKMEAIGQLAGGLAHDFNNMLTVISASVSSLEVDEAVCADPLNRESLSDIHEATQRAATMTRQLLAFSQRESADVSSLSVEVVAEALMPLLRRLITEDIAISAEYEADLGGIAADVTQLEQIIVNLVVNARDAMPEGGSLRMHCRNEVVEPNTFLEHHGAIQAGPYVVIEVSDTGMGMNSETRDRLFEPFFTTKPVGKGTGMGLATVYGIVAKAGGHIRVHSKEHKGTTFQIYWPREETPASEVTAAVEVITPDAFGRESILVVEDEPLIRKAVGRALRGFGYNVLEADNGRSALNVLSSANNVDLILTDVRMPEMNGPELVRAAIEERPAIKVMYMSGYTDGLLGADEADIPLLQKPFSTEALAQCLREVLTP